MAARPRDEGRGSQQRSIHSARAGDGDPLAGFDLKADAVEGAEHRAGVIDHMAFTATDLPGTVTKLEKAKVTWELRRLPAESVRGGTSPAMAHASATSARVVRSEGSMGSQTAQTVPLRSPLR